MIAFSKLGQYGRLGNQLFQYAFLRAHAHQLQTLFYCPAWDGDLIFDLQDESERSHEPRGLNKAFDPHPEVGFTQQALGVEDGTDIQGFFQSERYYADPAAVRRWYRFSAHVVSGAARFYDFSQVRRSASLSLRIDGDYGNTREYFPLYPLSYYRKALDVLRPEGEILIFADRPDLAKQFFAPLKGYRLRLVTELTGAEQLFLMTQCGANVITNSTFAWWGAWLNDGAATRVVAPSHWCRSGVPIPITDILCDRWIKLSGTVPVWDHFQMWRLRHPLATVRRITGRSVARKSG